MKYIPELLAAILTAFVAYTLHSWDVTRIETKHKEALVTQAKALNDQCTKEKLQTKEASDAYQQTLSNNITLRDKLINSLRDDSAVCVSSDDTFRPNGTTSGKTIVTQVGVKASTIIEEAAQCDDTRAKLIALQNFLKSTR